MKIERVDLRRRIVPGIAVIAGLLLALWPPGSSASAEPLRLGIFQGVPSALIYLADSQGFFKKEGVDVVIREYEAGALAVDDLIGNKVDIATGGDSVFVLQSFKHADVRMTATICVASDMEFVVRKDRGITRPQDLKGKRVAVVRGSQSEFFLHNYLLLNHISGDAVRIVYQTPSEMFTAIAGGTIDAALWAPPFTTGMERQLGAKGARWPAQNGQDYYFTLIAKGELLKKQPKGVERFLTALSDAETFISKYPDRAQTILLDRLKIDRDSLLSTWSRARFQLQLTQDLLVLMEREAKWAIRTNLVDKKEMPSYLGFLYFDALDKVKPEAVSIVH